jgi:hypothetical protein
MKDIQSTFQKIRKEEISKLYENKYVELENENKELKKEIEILHSLLHTLDFYQNTLRKEDKITELLGLIGNWSKAHRLFPGEYTREESSNEIRRSFNKIIDFLKPNF